MHAAHVLRVVMTVMTQMQAQRQALITIQCEGVCAYQEPHQHTGQTPAVLGLEADVTMQHIVVRLDQMCQNLRRSKPKG